MTFLNMFQSLLALISGAVIGLAFGMIQTQARRKYLRLQSAGQLKNEWKVVSGSSRRIAFLLILLVVIQFLCPLLFRNGIQWWVSGGVVAAYGLMLFWQLRRRLSGAE